MKKIKLLTAFAAGLVVLKLLKLKGSGGTSAPGKVALKICPEFIKFATAGKTSEIFTVTGTNGKTTTAGLLAHIAESCGKKIIHNVKGANMLSGIASVIVASACKKTDFAVFESDEAYLTKLYDYLNANYLIVTNLFRDQLDRYGELDTTYKKIKSAVEKNKNLKVLVNADDPTLEGISGQNETVFFGFKNIKFLYDAPESGAPSENTACPKCGENLVYNERFYAHLGKYECPKCGYKMPELKYGASVKVCKDRSFITLNGFEYVVGLPGLYNAFNALAAISGALEAGIPAESIAEALPTYKSVFGRSETRTLCGKKAFIQLIKNPVGASEVLRETSADKNSVLLVALNDNYADGRDVSWIWDADFELLKIHEGKIFITGTRAEDAALRLKYAGVDTKLFTIEKDLEKCVKAATEAVPADKTLYVMPTYTALLKISDFK